MRPFADLADLQYAHRIWQGQSLYLEPHHAHAAVADIGVPVGIGVTLMPLRHPYEAALQARSLAVVTGQPPVVGFGPGAPAFQRSLLGSAYASPLTATSEYLTAVRCLLDGQPVPAGRYYHCDTPLPPVPSPKVLLGAGVLRPKMAECAGAAADVAITWLTPPDYLADELIPALEAGATRAGRQCPRVVAVVPVATESRQHSAAETVLSGHAAHLHGDHYRDMLRRAGARLGEGDLRDAAELLRLGACLSGGPEEVRAGLAAYRAAGVDEVAINLTGVYNLAGSRAAADSISSLLRSPELNDHERAEVAACP